MSQWTHIIGCIRFDYMAQNCWCSDTNGRPKSYDPKSRIAFLKKVFSSRKPGGSEGPVGVEVVNSNRGPIVVISGDLRDFGLPELKNILRWLNRVHSRIRKENASSGFDDQLSIRDFLIRCDVEYHKYFHEIFLNKNDKWVIKEANKKED